MITTQLLSVAGTLLRRGVLTPFSRRFFTGRANMVYYHGVWPAGSTLLGALGGVTTDAFERDMAQLVSFFKPVSLSTMLALNASDDTTAEPCIAITFDDGLDLRRGGALDVLDRLRIPATTFVVLDCVDNRRLMWHHKLAVARSMAGEAVFQREFNRVSQRMLPDGRVSPSGVVEATKAWPMTRKDEYADEVWRACGMPSVEAFLDAERPYSDWADLEEWCRRGHTVGLHTRTHPFCSKLDSTGIADEIIESATLLCARLGVDAVPFAYPFGDRLTDADAEEVLTRGPVSCLLGIDGPRRLGTAAHRLGRSKGETDLNVSVFAKPVVTAVRAFIGA
jgi:peptidoglycan/xylan/chitin deacetylase (PgdA/CDA1 family)